MNREANKGTSPGRATRLCSCAALAAAALVPLGVAGEPGMRVRLGEGPEPVRVGAIRIEAGRSGLRIDGREAGPRWTAAPPGPHAVGALRVRGAVEVVRVAEGLRVVNRVGLEDYLAGTLGREVYPRWHDEALKAQAVVSRTYALHRREQRRGEGFDLEAGTRDQVYGGTAAETPRLRQAIAATRGQHLRHGGVPILAAFHSASGGHTASAEEVWGEAIPYLVAQRVPHEEDSPDTYWRARVTGTTLGRALAPLGLDVGPVRRVRVEARSPSGRSERLSVEGVQGRGSLTGRALRTALGEGVLRSTLFEVRSHEGSFVFVGSGHGHGVGMSQWGAESMARRGSTYREILAAFYPGTTLVTEGAR